MFRTRLLITIATLSASLLSFLAYTILLRVMGASVDVDQLFYASSVPTSLGGILTGVFVYLLPPRFAASETDGQLETFGVLVRLVIVVGLLMSAVGLVGWASQGGKVIWALYLVSTFAAGFTVIATIGICLAQARGEYLLAGVPPVCTAVGLLAGVIGSIGLKSVWPILLGQLLGSFLGLQYVGRALRIPLRSCIAVSRSGDRAELVSMLRKGGYVLIGTGAFTLFPMMDAILCARLGDGSITIMSYVQRVVVAAGTGISLGAYAIAARTSQDALQTGGAAVVWRKAEIEVLRIAGMGVLVWLVYLVGGYRVLAPLLSTNGGMRDSMPILVECLGVMLLGLGPMAAMPFICRVLYTLGNFTLPAIAGLIVPGMYFVLGYRLTADGALAGLGQAYAITWWVALAVVMVVKRRDLAASNHGSQ